MTKHRIRLICLMAVLQLGAFFDTTVCSGGDQGQRNIRPTEFTTRADGSIYTDNQHCRGIVACRTRLVWIVANPPWKPGISKISKWLARTILSAILPTSRQGPVQHAARSTAWSEYATECCT